MAVIKDLGAVSAYALAVEGGYTGTQEEFEQLMASYATVAQQAKQSAEDAEAYAIGKRDGTDVDSSDPAYHNNAAYYAGQASDSATGAASARDDAVSAKNDAVDAKTAAETAQGKAEDAQEGAEAAQAAADEVLESIPEDYSELSADVSDLKSQITSKAETNGGYPEMTVGSASQLLSAKGLTDKVPYLFRRSGGAGANRAKENAIVGGTLAWNQLVNKNDYTATETLENVTFTNNADGSITATSSGAATGTAVHEMGVISNNHLFVGHKYAILTGFATAGSATTYEYMVVGAKGNSQSWNIYNDTIVTINGVSNTSKFSRFVVRNGVTVTNLTIKPRIIDLTKALTPAIADYLYNLETATAGAGIAKLRSWGLCIKDYYSYDAGSLQSVQAASHITRGFNAWDEVWEVGGINTVGANNSATNCIRSKNYIQIVPGAIYYRCSSTNIQPFFYDANKAFISYSLWGKNREDTAPNNACYLRFIADPAYGTSYKNDICINLSDPTRNGEYEPYTSHTYPLDSSLTLRGIPELDADNNLRYNGDVYRPDGTVERRYGVLTLDNTIPSGTDGLRNITDLTTSVRAEYFPYRAIGKGNSAACISDKFTYKSTNDNYDPLIVTTGTSEPRLYLYMPASCTTEALIREYFASNPLTIVYEKATPTTEQADPYQETQIVDPYGTEEYIDAAVTAATPTRDVAIPVGHETYYPENATEKLAGLPWDFCTLIANTEKGFTATKPYSVNDFLIVNNQLYRVTASIANGATITPNTNVTATTLGAQITALLNA